MTGNSFREHMFFKTTQKAWCKAHLAGFCCAVNSVVFF